MHEFPDMPTPASETDRRSKNKSRLSTYLISTLVTAIAATVAAAAAAIVFLAQPHITHSSSASGIHTLRSYISYDVLAATVRDLYPPFKENPSCLHAEVLSPSNVIAALTIPSHDAPSLWDRLSYGHDEDTGLHEATPRSDTQGVWGWTFPGANGQVGIRLSNDSLLLAKISLRIPASEDRRPPSCAPRDVILWGILNQDEDSSTAFDLHDGLDLASALPVGVPLPVHDERDTILPLASFRYNRYQNKLEQTFRLRKPTTGMGLGFGVVVVQVLNNWGGTSTCIDRIHLQGCH